ncbi:GcrA family cell cycle regulator [Methylobacterium sp. J-068]|uniref:GcrA family cell cycle regulator n=1 Tax=Methylobacterium sp. J-068 TaxID=2836649 RepID=UPI001FBB4DFD|nr:GcrA family cell cycle regulator [Methylobacterium sp. J-068]MCJ2036985.1 GcrA family cell cycle regulator [Methylobacterium sp. J-068]
MVDTVPSWSDERVDQLRRLWEEGLSASQIATQLGGVTRNAVIGKVHRLGLSGRVKSAEMAGTASRRTGRDAESESALAVVEDVIPMVDLPVEIPPSTTPAPVALTISRRVTIMDLRESMCRWPIGDPTSPDFHYCGDRSITGLPYCTTHAQIAYQPAAERKRDRRIGGFR